MSDELLSLLSRSVENPTARTPVEVWAAQGSTVSITTTTKIVSPERQQWLDERRKGIGGSDISKILGLDPHGGPLDVWFSKVEGHDQPESEDSIRGQVLEAGLLEWYSRRTGHRVNPNKHCIQNLAHPIQRCTPDGLADCEKPGLQRIVSVKCPRRGGDQFGDYDGSSRFPQHWSIQLNWEHAVLTSARYKLDSLMHVAALVDGDLRIYHCEADTELQAVLLEQAEAFWERHVVAKVPPELDGSDGARAWIKRRFPTSNSTTRKASLDEDVLLQELSEAAKAKAKAEVDYETVRRRVEEKIALDGGIEGSAVTVTWRARRDGVRVFKPKFNWEK